MKRAAAKLREHPLVKRVDSLIRQWDGELTQDLVLHPGEFGLGKVPARLKPDDTTDMVFAAFVQLVAASKSILRTAKPSLPDD
jgi:hypothetical protein